MIGYNNYSGGDYDDEFTQQQEANFMEEHQRIIGKPQQLQPIKEFYTIDEVEMTENGLRLPAPQPMQQMPATTLEANIVEPVQEVIGTLPSDIPDTFDSYREQKDDQLQEVFGTLPSDENTQKPILNLDELTMDDLDPSKQPTQIGFDDLDPSKQPLNLDELTMDDLDPSKQPLNLDRLSDEALELAADPEQWSKTKGLGADLTDSDVRSYSQHYLERNPSASRTEILRGLTQEFGIDMVRPNENKHLMTIRSYIDNPVDEGIYEQGLWGIGEGLLQTAAGFGSAVGDVVDLLPGESGQIQNYWDEVSADSRKRQELRQGGAEFIGEAAAIAPLLLTPSSTAPKALAKVFGAAYGYERGQGAEAANAAGLAALDVAGMKLLDGVAQLGKMVTGYVSDGIPLTNLTLDQLKLQNKGAYNTIVSAANRSAQKPEVLLKDTVNWLQKTSPKDFARPADIQSVGARMGTSTKDTAKALEGRGVAMQDNIIAEAGARSAEHSPRGRWSATLEDPILDSYSYRVGSTNITDFKKLYEDTIYSNRAFREAGGTDDAIDMLSAKDPRFNADLVNAFKGKDANHIARAEDDLRMLASFDDVGLAKEMLGTDAVRATKDLDMVDMNQDMILNNPLNPKLSQATRTPEDRVNQALKVVSVSPTANVLVRAMRQVASLTEKGNQKAITQMFITDIAKGKIRIPTENVEVFASEYAKAAQKGELPGFYDKAKKFFSVESVSPVVVGATPNAAYNENRVSNPTAKGQL